MIGINKTKEVTDENGKKVIITITEYPEVPVIICNGDDDENVSDNNSDISDLSAS